MKKWIAASLISMMTVSSVFADCSNAYEVKARARADLIKDVKKAGAITGTVVISATTLATMAVIFVAIPGPGWFLIRLTRAFHSRSRYATSRESSLRFRS